MIKEALEYLASLGASAKDICTLEIPGNKLMVVWPSGDTQVFSNDRNRRTITVATLGSLVDWVEHNYDIEKHSVEIRVKFSCIEVLVDQTTHVVDYCKLRLPATSAMKTLEDWLDASRSVKAVVNYLRGPLADTYSSDYLKVFKLVNFKRLAQSTQKVQHTGESMGRSIESEAQSTEGEIPDVMAFNVHMLRASADIAAEPIPLKFAVTVDADNETISLNPIADCVERGKEVCVKQLVDYLTARLPGCLVLAAG